MALRFVDSFDHYAVAQGSLKWNTFSALAGNVTTRSGSGLAVRFNGGSEILGKTLTSQSSWVFGFALRFTSLPGAGTVFLELRDGSTHQCDLRITPNGQIAITRNGTVLTGGLSTTFSFRTGVWYYVEWKVTISNSISAGTCKVRVNETEVINVSTGQDTQNSGSVSTADNFRFVGQSSMTNHIDDLYVCDGTGSTNNDFLGDVKIACLYPDGAGDSTQWTPSTGSNYQCVDESTINSDTDYVSSATATNEDLYTFGNISNSTGSIFGIQVNLGARKDDGGTRTAKHAVKTGGTVYYGGDFNLTSSYLFQLDLRETNPNTTAAWTISEVNGAQFGINLVA